jgi:hypothetical protein
MLLFFLVQAGTALDFAQNTQDICEAIVSVKSLHFASDMFAKNERISETIQIILEKW